MMSKMRNTIVFLIGATILNLVIFSLIAFLLVIVFGLMFRSMANVSRGLSLTAVVLILIGASGGTLAIYSHIVKWHTSKRKQ